MVRYALPSVITIESKIFLIFSAHTSISQSHELGTCLFGVHSKGMFTLVIVDHERCFSHCLRDEGQSQFVFLKGHQRHDWSYLGKMNEKVRHGSDVKSEVFIKKDNV